MATAPGYRVAERISCDPWQRRCCAGRPPRPSRCSASCSTPSRSYRQGVRRAVRTLRLRGSLQCCARCRAGSGSVCPGTGAQPARCARVANSRPMQGTRCRWAWCGKCSRAWTTEETRWTLPLLACWCGMACGLLSCCRRALRPWRSGRTFCTTASLSFMLACPGRRTAPAVAVCLCMLMTLSCSSWC
ncbi:hypothetical protein D9M70_447400 [compost metagenome]